MAISNYLRELREHVGTSLILLPGVAALIRDTEGRILFQRRSEDGSWSLPAGAVDPGEEPARALAREVWEETGLIIRPERIAAVYGGATFRHTYPNGDEVEPTITVFECRVIGGSLEARDGESSELRYFPPDQVPQLALPYPREIIAGLEQRSHTAFQWEEAWSESLRADASAQACGSHSTN